MTIDRITETRCKHEVTCNNVGGKKDEACRRETRQNVHAMVLTDKLQSCIRND